MIVYRPSAPHLRYVGIQHLRALAVLMVVLCHIEMTLARPQYTGLQVADGWLTAGAIGVDLFFVVSGFIMVHTTDGLRIRPGAASRFLANRAIRILPFMWCCVSMYLVIALALHGRSVDPMPFLRSLTLFPVGELAPWEVWSLRHEMLFYGAVACALLGRGGRAVLWVFVLGAIPSGWWIDRGPQGPFEQWLAAFWSPRANLAFGAGLLVGLLHRRQTRPAGRADAQMAAAMLLVAPFALLGLGVAFPATVVGEPLASGQGSDLCRAVFVLPVLSGLVYGAAALRPPEGRVSAVLGGLGDASYSIYLTHVVFITAVAKLAPAVGLQAWPWLLVALAVSAALVGGWVVHLWVERPMQRACRRRFLGVDSPSSR